MCSNEAIRVAAKRRTAAWFAVRALAGWHGRPVALIAHTSIELLERATDWTQQAGELAALSWHEL